ncbi:phosphoprotein [Ord River virus]|uniref:Phosphoprotein n=1 Tax=Ord River virus TaxID=1620895 RepID=A0A0D3R1U4_9RHAB|nr:phosphoprotein [Ord River virus]AJR28598.1 phosphoprotein [Ord River virus]ASM90783.1 phosphoprotein [Ord River virus]
MDNYKKPCDLNTGLNWEKVSNSMENQVDDTESAVPDLSAFVHENAEDLKTWATSLEDWASKLPDPPEELKDKTEDVDQRKDSVDSIADQFSTFNIGPTRCRPGQLVGLIEDLCRVSRFGDMVTVSYKMDGNNLLLLYHVDSAISRDQHRFVPAPNLDDITPKETKVTTTKCCPLYKEVLEDLSKGIILKKRFGEGTSKLTMKSLGDLEDIETKWITTCHSMKRECLDHLLSLKGKKKMLLRTYTIDY